MRLDVVANELSIANNINRINKIIVNYLKQEGFRYFAFTVYSSIVRGIQKPKYDLSSSALQPWHDYYLNEFYSDIDRTLEKTRLNTAPIFWDVYQQLTVSKSKRESRLRQESINFGVRQGLSIPIHGPDNDFGSLTLHQCKNENTLKNYKEKQYTWIAASNVFYHHINQMLLKTLTKSKTRVNLTRRERQCIELTAKSYSVTQISSALKISIATVQFHLQNANKKLNVRNKYHAVNCYRKMVAEESTPV